MEIIFSGTIPKDLSSFDLNEDSFAICLNSNRLAVSDGASESFDSRSWSRIISDLYIANGCINEIDISEKVVEYNLACNYESLSWSKQAAFDRGSFASLLGLTIDPNLKEITVQCIGDTELVLVDGVTAVSKFPYADYREFDKRPTLLSTIDRFNKEVFSSENLLCSGLKVSYGNYKEPYAIAFSDAIAQWALKLEEAGVPVWEQLFELKSIEQLIDLVSEARASKEMRVDDVTVVIIKL